MIFNKKLYSTILIFFLCVTFTIGQSHISTQSHQAAVTSIAVSNDGSFYTAGQDGFIIKWTSDGLGEHYQITELEIRLIAVHPNGNDIAVYETDGYSIHRISIWNWPSLKRKNSKNFSNAITSLSFTAKGTLLAVGSATVNGVTYLNPITGRDVPKLKESTGIVNMIVGSSSEKSSVMYSPAGHLSYYNMTTGLRKQRFQTEQQLEQVVLFNNNLFCAGIKNNYIYIIDALSGKTINKIKAENPTLYQDTTSKELYYSEKKDKNYTLYQISGIHNSQNISISNPTKIKTFTGIDRTNTITSSIKKNDQLILGTKNGNIYVTDIIKQDTTLALLPITDNMYDKVFDIVSIGNDFYCLTSNTIYKTSFDTGIVEKICSNDGFSNLDVINSNIILWNKNSKKKVAFLDLETKTQKDLFIPKNYIQNLKPFGNKIIFIEGNTTVKLFDISNNTTSELYKGTGIQDAILYNDMDLYVAKSASSNPRSPLIHVNTQTKETVMLPINGNVAFSLSYNDNPNNPIYGIQVITQNKATKTNVFAYYPNTKTVSSIIITANEDIDAFLNQYNTTLYTNIGKDQIRSYDTKTKKQLILNRSASLPLKIARTETRIAILNRDGSISWYTPNNPKVLADWYMTIDGMWFEF